MFAELAELPDISVIIPTRDRPDLLNDAVQSVVTQDYAGQIAVIVVSDGGSVTLPASVPERRSLRALSNDRVGGPAGARNCGLMQASGELVAFCDDDDTWLPNKLSLQVAALRSDPALLGIGSGYVLERPGRATVRMPHHPRLTREHLLHSREADVHLSTLMFRRAELLSTVGLFDEELPGGYGEDYDLLLRVAHVSPLGALTTPLVRVRWHPGSFFTGQWQVIVQAIPYLLDKHPDFADDPQGRARLYGRLAFAHAALGERTRASSWAWRALQLNPRERRAYLALVTSARLLSPKTVVRVGMLAGKGV